MDFWDSIGDEVSSTNNENRITTTTTSTNTTTNSRIIIQKLCKECYSNMELIPEVEELVCNHCGYSEPYAINKICFCSSQKLCKCNTSLISYNQLDSVQNLLLDQNCLLPPPPPPQQHQQSSNGRGGGDDDEDGDNDSDEMLGRSDFTDKKIRTFIRKWVKNMTKPVVPKEIISKIKIFLSNLHININSVTPVILKRVLKEMGESKYYNYSYYIIIVLRGGGGEALTKLCENEILDVAYELEYLLQQIHVPYIDYLGKKKKNKHHSSSTSSNKIMYSYFGYMICTEILNRKEFVETFPIIGSASLIHYQEIVWKELVLRMLHWSQQNYPSPPPVMSSIDDDNNPDNNHHKFLYNIYKAQK